MLRSRSAPPLLSVVSWPTVSILAVLTLYRVLSVSNTTRLARWLPDLLVTASAFLAVALTMVPRWLLPF